MSNEHFINYSQIEKYKSENEDEKSNLKILSPKNNNNEFLENIKFRFKLFSLVLNSFHSIIENDQNFQNSNNKLRFIYEKEKNNSEQIGTVPSHCIHFSFEDLYYIINFCLDKDLKLITHEVISELLYNMSKILVKTYN